METEDVFRNANERIAEKAHLLGWSFPVPFLCECSDTGCFARVELTLAEYRHVRAHPQRYLAAPGHEVAEAFVLERGDSVSIAEKLYSST